MYNLLTGQCIMASDSDFSYINKKPTSISGGIRETFHRCSYSLGLHNPA